MFSTKTKKICSTEMNLTTLNWTPTERVQSLAEGREQHCTFLYIYSIKHLLANYLSVCL